jgi:hypothetical protein
MLTVLFWYSLPFLLLPHSIASNRVLSRSMMHMWFMLPFFVMMVLMGNQTTNDEEEEVEYGPCHGEEEEIGGSRVRPMPWRGGRNRRG